MITSGGTTDLTLPEAPMLAAAPDNRMLAVDVVAIHPKVADVAAWLHYRSWGVPGGSQRFWFRLIVSVALLVTLAHLLVGRWSPWGATIAGTALALARFPWWRWFGFSHRARQLCRQEPEQLRAYNCIASPAGLVLAGPDERTVAPWSSFTAMIATERYLFFEQGSRAIILPRRDFPSTLEAQEFFDLCEACWQTAMPVAQPAASTRVIPGDYRTRLTFDVKDEDLPALREAVVRARARTLVHWLNRNPVAGIELILFLLATPALGWQYGGATLFAITVAVLAVGIGAGTWCWDRAMAAKCLQSPGEQEISLSPRGVVLTHADGEIYCFNWSALDQVVCTSHCVLFQSRRGTSIGIPERVFQDRTELQQFLDCAREWHARTTDVELYPRPT